MNEIKINSKYLLLFLQLYWELFVLLQIIIYFSDFFKVFYSIFLFFSFVCMPVLYPTLIWVIFRDISGNLKGTYSKVRYLLLSFIFFILVLVTTISNFLYFFFKMLGSKDISYFQVLLICLPMIIAERWLSYYYKKYKRI